MEPVKVAKHLFKVVSKQQLTPHYIRIKLQGKGAKDFANCTLGVNNKILLHPAPSADEMLDFDALTWDQYFGSHTPIMRTYTHRAIDIASNTITVDFVFHGDNGPASKWANHAAEGSVLGVAMKLKADPLVPPVDWYLLVGDATAIPVLSCIIESLPSSAKGKCILEVASKEDIHTPIKHDGIDIEWIINPHPELGSTLEQVAKTIAVPSEATTFGYIAAEYSTVKGLRQYLKNDLAWNNKQFYAFSYWKSGVAEDQSATARRAEKEEQE